MSITPYISVVVPVYNRSEFSTEAIDSVINQTFKDFELIIVDDGSDNARCLRIINDYEKQDTRVKVIHQENGGLAQARNTGIAHARGKYIAFMDDDDISHPTRLEKQAKFLDQHPDVAMVAPLSTYIDSRGRPLKDQPAYKAEPCIYKPFPGADDLLNLADMDAPCLGADAMGRTDILKELRFNTFFLCAEDTDITLRLMEKYQIVTLPEKLYYYRKHDKNTLSVSSNERMLYYLLAAYLCAYRRRQGKPEPIGENTDVLDLIPLFKELPTVIIVHLLKRLRHKSKRLLYNRQYDRLETLLANMDKAFLDSEHAKAYGRIRKKNLQALTLKALQHGRWGWFVRRFRKRQPTT